MRYLIIILLLTASAYSQDLSGPPMEFGVSHTLAKWRAAHYSDVRYKLDLTLEKMSPVLKGTIEIRVRVGESGSGGVKETASNRSEPGAIATGLLTPIILDWRKIAGHEKDSTISNVTINGKDVSVVTEPISGANISVGEPQPLPRPPDIDNLLLPPSPRPTPSIVGFERSEHLIFHDGVVAGENVIKLDFTSPILTSGSAITRYVDKEDGAEYIYSLFVPSDASTAFPVFDQPDLKARFKLSISQTLDQQKDLKPQVDWKFISNTPGEGYVVGAALRGGGRSLDFVTEFPETKPISTYVFAFAAGPFEQFGDTGGNASVNERANSTSEGTLVNTRVSASNIYVRKSQAAKFKPHAAEVFRLNREGIKFLESYFDYKFPFPKYDIVLIPEFPFGGMEHAGATFLRESSVIFPTEPTANDYISRANVIFHETAHQWFGDTVTMKWFDDLWLKEGFAEFMAYKTLEKVMPEYNAWKVFYERNKQAAYLTDSTKGTTPIYQEIANLNSAKSAYGNIVYRKAPSFLRQAEFYLGEDKFKVAVRAFLKKYQYANAGWEDLVKEFEAASKKDLKEWALAWVTTRGVTTYRISRVDYGGSVDWTTVIVASPSEVDGRQTVKPMTIRLYSLPMSSDLASLFPPLKSQATINGDRDQEVMLVSGTNRKYSERYYFPNYEDYGYGIFLLDDKSRDYVLKNVQNEKDAFLRSMMYGALWDSVREGELDPRQYVELVIKNLETPTPSAAAVSTPPSKVVEQDESIVQSIIGRAATAMRYYMSEPTAEASGSDKIGDLNARFEAILLERMQNAQTTGQRITFFRALVANATTETSRAALKQLLTAGGNVSVNERAASVVKEARSLTVAFLPVKAKDRFDIVTRLLALNDPDALKLLADLEKTETSDDAKRYAYAARAAIPTKENKAKYWNDFVNNKDISESWIEAAFGPWNNIRHSELTLPYLQEALLELPNHKRNRKIFFVNGWLGAFIGGQRSEQVLAIINKFLADNPNLDKDLRLKILENSDLIERAVRVRGKYGKN